MKHSITLLAITCSLFSIAQTNEHFCAKRDAFSANQLKSNSLSVAQIAETERYNVHFYALDIAMDNLTTHVEGTGEIHGTANELLDSVLFELFPTFNISEIRLNGSPIAYSRTASAIKVPVNITTGQSFSIAIDYDGTPPTGATNPLGGSGMTNDSSPSWGNQVTWSLSEPFSAYEWWPCKQSLKDKADSVSMKITVPNSCKAGSNGTLENVVDLGNGTSRYEWMHRHPIVYYLVSVAVAEYIEYNVYANPAGSVSPVLIQNYIYDNPGTLPNFQNDIDETVDFMELFADLFGPYPFQDEKYGHCMAPLSGGMEHQTMTTQGFFVKGLTAHELGHQWWGDHVTCASWADIWVNEGFASYSEYLMLENSYPAEYFGHMLGVHNNVKSFPSGSVWVEDSLNENRIFSGRRTYDKGAAILHTFRFMFNDDPLFFQTLRDFQVDFADGFASGIDIRDYFANATGTNFDAAFNEWYFGEGYPTYSARWNVDNGDLLVRVTHTTSSSTPTFTNPLELRFTRTSAPDTTITFAIEGNTSEFIVPNMANVTALNAIDPNNWIINNVGFILHDTDLLVGLETIDNNPVLSIYPNPSNGIFTVASQDQGVQKINVLDTRGRLLISADFEKNYEVNITNEKAGNYIVQIVNDKGEKRIQTIVKN